MLGPLTAAATTVDESTAGDFNDEFGNPTALPSGTTAITGELLFTDDQFDTAAFSDYFPTPSITSVDAVFEFSTNSFLTIFAYDQANNVYQSSSIGVGPSDSSPIVIPITLAAHGVIDVRMQLSGFEEGTAQASYTFTLPPPPVPEPAGASGALAALGALVARRRARPQDQTAAK